MYIKQVIIQGFKSYREQTVVEPFDHRHNVVVGRNGSGKSNFFYAIQFVLSDEFSHLRPEQRQALLHEGTGARVMTAYVEILFDNSDGRIPEEKMKGKKDFFCIIRNRSRINKRKSERYRPVVFLQEKLPAYIERDEVPLRRVIGAKKDSYFLNKKNVPRQDVMNLLESAGFSRSNPYYIVKQGKINQMATAPDSQRLKLLREVAGTRVYDERREESQNILQDTKTKIAKIDDFLHTIDERLKTLEEEKEELKEYQKWDKIRRSLEYCIFDKELKDAQKKLKELEDQRKNSNETQNKLNNELKKAQDEVHKAGQALRKAKKDVAEAKYQRDTLSSEQAQLLKEKTKLELTIKDLTDEVSGDNKSKERAESELNKLKEQIDEKKKQLERIKPQYEEMKKKEENCNRELALKEQKRKELYAKQGRGSQFTSKEERDQWIQKELKLLRKQIKDKEDHRDKIAADLEKDAKRSVELEKEIEARTKDMELLRMEIDRHNKDFYEIKKKKDQLQVKRGELWRKETQLNQQLTSAKEDLAKADQALRSLAGKPTLNGRDSVCKVLETFRERGGHWKEIADKYYNPVIENFTCAENIYTAVEVTAGARLFHHIVESDRVGTEILKEMNKQKLPGEVTFMPLNRLIVREQNYPKTEDAIPMVSKLVYEPKYEKAMKYLFGKTLICRNLESATNLARSTGLDCVTLDGDQVSSKGSLTGGYFNSSRSRLETQKKRTEHKTEMRKIEEELNSLKVEMKTVEQDISSVVADLQKTENKNAKHKDNYDQCKSQIRLMKEELQGIERYKNPKERSLTQCTSSLEAIKTTKEGLENELHQELMEQLSREDQEVVDQLNDDIRRLTQENKEAFTMRMRLEAEKNKLDNLLTNNLIRRHDELIQALQEISVEDRKRQLENCTLELANVEARVAEVNRDFKAMEKKVKEATDKQKKEQSALEEWKNKEKVVQDKLDEDSKGLEKIGSKENALKTKIEEAQNKITEMGSVPSVELIQKYQQQNQKYLFKELEKANNNLKKYSHVNKKALDQFISFSEQKEKLYERKAELDRGEEKIQELLNHLETRKTEAIQFTFKQVAKYFSEVFKKLVPQGSGELVIHSNRSSLGPNESSLDVSSADEYTGVGIKVSFTSTKSGEMREMNQLSGGQKSLVALALIFAIQKCDPAPFYLFDEIDQALDAQHRKAVADMIHELSKTAQFITTTFRPELLEHAHKFYGVKFRNKVSHVDCVSREEAYDFVEDDTTHG